MRHTLDLGALGEIAIDVTYYYAPGRLGRLYDRHGDPGDPPEGDELEILSATLAGDSIETRLANHLAESEDFLEQVRSHYAERGFRE